MAQRIETDRRSSGGLENLLDVAANFIFVIGVILAAAVLVWQRLFGIVPAVVILINSAIGWLLLRSIAEIIRIQKKMARLPYTGMISGGDQIVVYKCSDCGAMLHSESWCDSCGTSIDAE